MGIESENKTILKPNALFWISIAHSMKCVKFYEMAEMNNYFMEINLYFLCTGRTLKLVVND